MSGVFVGFIIKLGCVGRVIGDGDYGVVFGVREVKQCVVMKFFVLFVDRIGCEVVSGVV